MARLHILLPTTIAGSSWPSRLDVDMRAPPPLRFVDPIEENQDRDPMLIGHYAPALALARFRPSVKLWHLFVATQLVDVFWALFILGGIEHARVVPGFTASNDLDLWDMPYTHSLVATLLWAGAAFAVWRAIGRGAGRTGDALVVAAAVASHFVADFLVHAGDLPVMAAQGTKLGLGLWQNRPAALIAAADRCFRRQVSVPLPTLKAVLSSIIDLDKRT